MSKRRTTTSPKVRTVLQATREHRPARPRDKSSRRRPGLLVGGGGGDKRRRKKMRNSTAPHSSKKKGRNRSKIGKLAEAQATSPNAAGSADATPVQESNKYALVSRPDCACRTFPRVNVRRENYAIVQLSFAVFTPISLAVQLVAVLGLSSFFFLFSSCFPMHALPALVSIFKVDVYLFL